jgi:hypothetical protein
MPPLPNVLPLDWVLIALAIVVPLPLGLFAAWLCWRKTQVVDVGNVLGSGIILFAGVLCWGNEFVRVLRATSACETAGTPCVMHPSPFMRFAIFAVIAFVQVAMLYVISAVRQERASRRDYWQ